MGLKSTIETNVENAFSILGDLTVDVTLTKNSNSYSFGTSDVSSKTTNVTVKGVLLANATLPNETGRTGSVLILKSADVGTLGPNDSFKVGQKTYRFRNYVDNGFTVEVEISGGTQ